MLKSNLILTTALHCTKTYVIFRLKRTFHLSFKKQPQLSLLGGARCIKLCNYRKTKSNTFSRLFPLFCLSSCVLFSRQAFSKMGPLLSAIIAKKKDPKKPGMYDKDLQRPWNR